MRRAVQTANNFIICHLYITYVLGESLRSFQKFGTKHSNMNGTMSADKTTVKPIY